MTDRMLQGLKYERVHSRLNLGMPVSKELPGIQRPDPKSYVVTYPSKLGTNPI